MLRRKFIAVTLAALLAAPSLALAQRPGSGPNPLSNIDVTGTFTDALGGLGTFTGTMTIARFGTLDGQLAAVGTITGTLTDSLGNIIGTVTNAVLTILVNNATGTCDILHLELGPLDLDLLGLVVHLDPVVLDITAEQGPGNLLGNLLCGIAGLLDSNAALSGLVRALNQLVGLLG